MLHRAQVPNPEAVLDELAKERRRKLDFCFSKVKIKMKKRSDTFMIRVYFR